MLKLIPVIFKFEQLIGIFRLNMIYKAYSRQKLSKDERRNRMWLPRAIEAICATQPVHPSTQDGVQTLKTNGITSIHPGPPRKTHGTDFEKRRDQYAFFFVERNKEIWNMIRYILQQLATNSQMLNRIEKYIKVAE